MTAPPLTVKDLSVHYQGRRDFALEALAFQVRPGRISAVIGPNGAGKSTLIKAALGLVPAVSGEALFFGKPLKEVRGRIAYVPQRSAVDWDFPVRVIDVAAMGLYRKIGWFRPVARKHREEALHYLDQVGIADLANRQIGQLSGGQQQRVFLARALAQDADLTLMDEPLNGIDVRTQDVIMKIFQDMKNEQKTLLIVHHDLQGVHSCFDDAFLLNRTLIAGGPVDTVMTPENLQKAYHFPVRLFGEGGCHA